jgi:hypothetical protein
VLADIAAARVEMLQLITGDLDPATQDTMVSALLGIKAALSAERRAARDVA